MIAPLLILDGHEQWRPVPVEALIGVGARVDGKRIETLDQLELNGERIDFPAEMHQPEGYPPVGYHRIVAAGGLVWHQFWTFWLYNPKKYAGFGEHEGDWEMVQLGCTDEAGEHPVLMTCSQHDGGEKREFWRCELGAEGRPAAYVARDSHANYFAVHRDVTDQADGMGEQLSHMTWHEFGGWAGFPGKWGASSNSPGALPTRRAWTAPHAWHGQARG